MKTYYIKNTVMVQAERMREKLKYFDVMLLEKLKDNEIKYEEYEEKATQLATKLDELDIALDNVTSDKGCYNYKAEWKYVEVLNKYASQRDVLDSLCG